jgi:DDE superfamily endonuclease
VPLGRRDGGVGRGCFRQPGDGTAGAKKNDLKPWITELWCLPPQANAEYVWRMEDVIATYQLPYDPQYPVVCFDEACKQLFGEVRPPQAAGPGRPARQDCEYERKGVCHQLVLCEPLAGWRHVRVTERRTRKDYAECLRELVDVYYPDAKKIRLVQDNLNTHDGASLYEAFAPEDARRILDRLEFHYTPKHGSWLNLAESEISIMNSQCLDRRLESVPAVAQEVTPWEEARNAKKIRVHWTFTVAAARLKLKKLYPSIEQ